MTKVNALAMSLKRKAKKGELSDLDLLSAYQSAILQESSGSNPDNIGSDFYLRMLESRGLQHKAELMRKEIETMTSMFAFAAKAEEQK